ncbi:hypothetical protein P3T35_000501 [Kitasatospora sp. GP30]|uniref:DUF932 domain-containing protein n=1 Tax=Kitasatospora sp. GP30 TaxID=3035084 RepID=UPI000C70C828|nr:DUF932 domain-containing protein [Kitasatospora sp. GP30]MDH6138524.1 hypothetical protein [Kitasatospora sp. GP30]
MTISLTTPTRHAGLREIADVLRDEQKRKLDVVAPASGIRAEGGRLVIDDTEHELTPDGVTSTPGAFRPTGVAEAGLAEKLGIPTGYLRKTRIEAPELWDSNVNGWLARRTDKSFMVRTLRPGNGEDGNVARAFLSNGYRIIDNLDVLTAALEGITSAGVAVRIDSCDLTDRKMYVRVVADEIRAYAPELLRNYRSPFNGATGADNPTVFAGFEISNSETGCGAFRIVPRLVVQVCNNGMTITRDAMKSVHVGGRQDDGVIQWSDQTQTRTLELVTSQTADAVRCFLDRNYITRHLRSIEEKSTTRITDPEATITNVSQKLKFTEDRRRDIFAHFIQGADLSAGGVMHAVTSVAQTLPDADEAAELESLGIRAMELAASL